MNLSLPKLAAVAGLALASLTLVTPMTDEARVDVGINIGVPLYAPPPVYYYPPPRAYYGPTVVYRSYYEPRYYGPRYGYYPRAYGYREHYRRGHDGYRGGRHHGGHHDHH